MDTKLQLLRRDYYTNPSLEALQRFLSLKSRVLPHTVLKKIILGDIIKAPLKQVLIKDIEWCELEHNKDPWSKNLYIEAPREWIVAVLTDFCRWEETDYSPYGRKNIYINRNGDNCFVRRATPSEAPRFFYERMRGQPYEEMVKATQGKNISVIYGAFGSRVE